MSVAALCHGTDEKGGVGSLFVDKRFGPTMLPP
jgi:hypothetical protein